MKLFERVSSLNIPKTWGQMFILGSARCCSSEKPEESPREKDPLDWQGFYNQWMEDQESFQSLVGIYRFWMVLESQSTQSTAVWVVDVKHIKAAIQLLRHGTETQAKLLKATRWAAKHIGSGHEAVEAQKGSRIRGVKQDECPESSGLPCASWFGGDCF